MADVAANLPPHFMTKVTNKAEPKPENIWLNLLCNVVLPTVILSTLSKPERLGPLPAMLVGLAFPLGYGIYDLIRRRKANFLSILGVVSVLLTGGLGLMKVSNLVFAIKEAAIPLILGVAIVGSLKTRTPLIRTMLYNEQIIEVDTVQARLEERGAMNEFNRLMWSSTWLMAAAFFLSAGLNFALARLVLKSPPGSTGFTEELGRMHALSWLVITVPALGIMMFALWRLLKRLSVLTGLETDAILRAPPPKLKEKKVENG